MMKGNQSSNENFEVIHGDNFARLGGHHLSTTNQSQSHRIAWLKEVIGREYANVEVMPYEDESIYNDMAITHQ